MEFKKFFICSILVICSTSLSAQVDSSNFDDLICKEWLLKFYEEDDDKFPPAPENKNNVMIFYKDKKVKSIESDKIQNGSWEYDNKKKILTIVDNDTNEKVILKVLKLTSSDFVIEYKDSEGAILKMYMIPKL